ncbi:MAG TPA: XdhC family protein [Bacteroidales bacterium]|nr:XdhC family protein [Bacteroidales bacterium]
MKNIYLQVIEHQFDNAPLVLATVTRTKGSTPQKPGSSALFGKRGLIFGTVGGGVVEGRVAKLAQSALKSKKSAHCQFNLANDISFKDEAICGGQITVLIDANIRNHLSVFEQIKVSYEKRTPGVLITMVTQYSEDTVLINRYWMTSEYKPEMPVEFLSGIEPVVTKMLSERNSSDYRELELSIPGEEPSSLFFLEAVFPPEKLIIAGSGHIGKALAHLGAMIDFEVTVIDDRPEYANIENIPEADHIIVNNIGKTLEELNKSEDTFVVIVTRGHKDDAEALKPCIGSGLAYTGMIGSKSKIASMKSSFIDNGWATIKEWDSIYTPIGLEINSKTVKEIAISIAAQLILVRNSKKVNSKH